MPPGITMSGDEQIGGAVGLVPDLEGALAGLGLEQGVGLNPEDLGDHRLEITAERVVAQHADDERSLAILERFRRPLDELGEVVKIGAFQLVLGRRSLGVPSGGREQQPQTQDEAGDLARTHERSKTIARFRSHLGCLLSFPDSAGRASQTSGRTPANHAGVAGEIVRREE